MLGEHKWRGTPTWSRTILLVGATALAAVTVAVLSQARPGRVTWAPVAGSLTTIPYTIYWCPGAYNGTNQYIVEQHRYGANKTSSPIALRHPPWWLGQALHCQKFGHGRTVGVGALPWGDVVILGGVALALVGAILIWWMRHERDRPSDEATPELDIGASPRRHRSPLDPREMILLAFSDLQDALRAAGRPRRRSELATGYLRRVLPDDAPTRAAARTIAERYAMARYSPHACRPADAVEAEAAVRALGPTIATLASGEEKAIPPGR